MRSVRIEDKIRIGMIAAILLTAGAARAQDEAAADGEQWTDSGEAGAALPEMVVEAVNDVRQKIEKSTFTFDLDAASVDSFYSVMDQEVLGVSPVSGLQPHLNNLERLVSDQPPHLWLPDMAGTPVATFYPSVPEGHRIEDWSLTVVDFRGSPFRTFTGKRKAPESLAWDGNGENGEMLRVGYPYSYVFTQTDRGTNTYNYAGVSFRIPALDYRREGDRVLEMTGDELFVRDQSALTGSGERWLVRSTDVIRQHPYSPIRVVVTAERQALADERADVVASFLAESMILPREQVETAGVRKPDLRAEMDGSVAVVIEHVED